jgi:hypothetical protein
MILSIVAKQRRAWCCTKNIPDPCDVSDEVHGWLGTFTRCVCPNIINGLDKFRFVPSWGKWWIIEEACFFAFEARKENHFSD